MVAGGSFAEIIGSLPAFGDIWPSDFAPIGFLWACTGTGGDAKLDLGTILPGQAAWRPSTVNRLPSPSSSARRCVFLAKPRSRTLA